jgi:hypothetical protein
MDADSTSVGGGLAGRGGGTSSDAGMDAGAAGSKLLAGACCCKATSMLQISHNKSSIFFMNTQANSKQFPTAT